MTPEQQAGCRQPPDAGTELSGSPVPAPKNGLYGKPTLISVSDNRPFLLPATLS